MKNLVIASPSRWLAGCVRQSALFSNTRVEVLPNGVDHERFRPMAHDLVRDILGLRVPAHHRLGPVNKGLEGVEKVVYGAGYTCEAPHAFAPAATFELGQWYAYFARECAWHS